MNADDKRKLENKLMAMGLSRLEERALIPQMALLIKDHDFFLGMLQACEVEKRYTMYEALRPHLKFEPWPLHVYEEKMRERASNVASWGEAVTVGENKYEIVPANESSGVVISMRCHKCKRSADFYGDTPVSAVILARQDGWLREKGTEKEVCPKCECSDRQPRRKCPSCGRRHFAPPCTAVHAEPCNPTEQAELEERFRKVTIN